MGQGLREMRQLWGLRLEGQVGRSRWQEWVMAAVGVMG